MENKHPKVYIHTKIGKIAVYHHFANSDKTPISASTGITDAIQKSGLSVINSLAIAAPLLCLD